MVNSVRVNSALTEHFSVLCILCHDVQHVFGLHDLRGIKGEKKELELGRRQQLLIMHLKCISLKSSLPGNIFWPQTPTLKYFLTNVSHTPTTWPLVIYVIVQSSCQPPSNCMLFYISQHCKHPYTISYQMKRCSFSEWEAISRKTVHMDPSHVTKTTQRDHSNFRAMNDVMPKLVHRIALGTARLRLHNKAHSFKKLKSAEKMLKGHLRK